jgi:hypothetical protein
LITRPSMLTADHCDDHQADQTQPLLVASVTVGQM